MTTENNLYKKNTELLIKYREKLYEKYQDLLSRKEDWEYSCDELVVQEARDGSPVFRAKRGGEEVRLNSPYRPWEEARRWAGQFAVQNMKTNIILFGIGNGMFPMAILERLQEDGKLFLFEPCFEMWETALHHMDLEPLLTDERVLFFFSDINSEEFIESIRVHTHWTNVKSQVICHHTGYEKLFLEEYHSFLVQIQKNTQMTRINRDTQNFFSKRMVSNSVRNLVFIKDSRLITDYVGKIPREVPAIIVAAGPSLDKNIEILKKAKGKAFILAVDTAVRHLVKHNVMPDAMVTLDAGKPSSYISDEAIAEIPLFCALESRAEIMEFHKGIKIWFKSGSFLEQMYGRYGKEFIKYNPGGSVATAAFSICCALEFHQIVFVGQDLAYSGDVTHAGGEVSRVINEEYGIEMIDGVDGKPVKSRYDWIIYRDWFEESIQEIKSFRSETEVIDATEGGALIHGSELMTLQEVIDRYCQREVDIAAIIQAEPPTFTEEEYGELLCELKDYPKELRTMKEWARKAKRACEEALKLLETSSASSRFPTLQKTITESNQIVGEQHIYELMDLYISQTSTEYLGDVFMVSDDARQDEINMYQNALKVYQAIYDASEELYPEFREVIDKIE